MIPCLNLTCKGKTGVIDSRFSKPLHTTIRRRHCFKCKIRWTTVEIDIHEYKNLKQVKEVIKSL